MTWTKLGDEWPDAARVLSDAAYRTHVDGLCWSNRRQLDLLIPKSELRRFAETDDPDTAVKELVHAGWWDDRGDGWYIGLHFPDWQLDAATVASRREKQRERVQRFRLHNIGNHSMCRTEHCESAAAAATGNALPDALPGTGRDGSGSEKNAVCRRHRLPLPCRGCAADAKAAG